MNNDPRRVSPEHAAFLTGVKKEDGRVKFFRYFILAAVLMLWELAADTGFIDPFIFSSPSRVAATIARLYANRELFKHIGITLFETVAGFILGTVIGIFAAILLWWSNSLSRILDPYLVVLNALPKIALGPVLIVWFGAGIKSIIAMGLLISLVVTIISVLAGFNEITGEKQLLMRTLGASKLQILTMVVLPASVPTVISALKISVGMSWVGVIVGEYLVSRAGLGYLIVYGSQVFKLDLVMSSVVLLCVLAAGMYYAVAFFEKRLIRWRSL